MKVSICTSVFNQAELLKRAIDSVRAQTFQDWEHIIVDDHSTENIKGLVESYNDPRLVYSRFPENRGSCAGYNYALSLAAGDYICLLAADEFYWERKLEVQVEWMEQHPDVGCTWGLPSPNVGQAWPLGERPTWEQFQQMAHNRTSEAWIRDLLGLRNTAIGGASMLMRRWCQKAIGGLDKRYHAVSDLEWFVRFFKKFKGHILPYRLADATHPDGRLSNQKQEQFEEDIRRAREEHPVRLPKVIGKVSIGIPVYNQAHFIEHAIRAALSQTYTDIEVLILDDGSTDNVQEVIGNFEDPRIKYFKFDENRGTVAAINQMAAMAEGLFYVSLAADDVIEPTFVEKAVNQFKADPWLEFVASQTDFIDEAGNPYVADHPFKTIAKARNMRREEWLDNLRHGNLYFGVGMYRRAVLLEVGGWNPEFGVLTDYEMYLRLLQRENIFILEENLTHTRIHGANKSLLTPEEGRKLRQRYYDAKLAYYQPRMKVIIATPFYEMRGFSPYIVSMVQTVDALTKFGIDHEFWELSGDSYVDRAKNTLFNKFLEDPFATDLFMIDSDMQWGADAFLKMLFLPEEIVQGSYPQKNMWDVFTARPSLVEQDGKFHPVGRMLDDGTALIKAEYLAGGFIRIKREALQRFKDHFKDLVYMDVGADPNNPQRVYTEFFTCERRPQADGGIALRWGEDRVFGLRMKEVGIDSWIYPNANFGHYGIKGWHGNFHQHLMQQAAANGQQPPS